MAKISNKWNFSDRHLQDFVWAVIRVFNNLETSVGSAFGAGWDTAIYSIKDCWEKFHKTTGHKHTGVTDDAPNIPQLSIEKMPDETKFYLSNTTESYLKYTDTGIQLWFKGTKVVEFN